VEHGRRRQSLEREGTADRLTDDARSTKSWHHLRQDNPVGGDVNNLRLADYAVALELIPTLRGRVLARERLGNEAVCTHQ
jgi:hypothetical protein